MWNDLKKSPSWCWPHVASSRPGEQRTPGPIGSILHPFLSRGYLGVGLKHISEYMRWCFVLPPLSSSSDKRRTTELSMLLFKYYKQDIRKYRTPLLVANTYPALPGFWALLFVLLAEVVPSLQASCKHWNVRSDEQQKQFLDHIQVPNWLKFKGVRERAALE